MSTAGLLVKTFSTDERQSLGNVSGFTWQEAFDLIEIFFNPKHSYFINGMLSPSELEVAAKLVLQGINKLEVHHA